MKNKYKILAHIGLTDFNYHFRVLNNSQINAFTLPGGNIFIYSGLIKYTQSPEELAAVIAHEIGHAEKRHVIIKLEKEFGLAVLFSILTGNNGTILTEISRTATSAVFDRKQESEADAYAFQLLEKSGIDPLAFATLFRRINDEQGTNSLDFAILRTHPDNNSRIKAAMEYKTEESFKSKPFNIDWKKIKTSLNDTI
jgi:beta-barrel assembly-enhancing protease